MKADKTAESFPWIQPIKLRKQEFARLENLAVLSAYILPIEKATEERSYERILFFSHAKKQVFFKNTQNQCAKVIISKKMTKIFYSMVDFFNKFYELEMKLCAKEVKLKSKIEFRSLMENMKKRCLDLLAQYEACGYLKKWW